MKFKNLFIKVLSNPFLMKNKNLVVKVLSNPPLFCLLLLGVLIFLFYNYEENIFKYLDPNNSIGKIQIISFIGLFFTAVLGIGIAYWQLRIEKKSKEQNNKNIEIGINSSIDERFKDAIELLRSEKEPTRLEAMYALHHLATESFETEKSYTKSVFEILCSYIREKTNEEKYINKYADTKNKNVKPSIEIQTIIDLLFRIETERIPYKLFIADLNHAQLRGADLNSAFLSFANLKSAKLFKANLNSAKLFKANLDSTSLKNANLSFANLNSAILKNANLSFANLNSADLTSADLTSANLFKANLFKVNLKSAFLDSANLDSADLESTNLENADFSNANLKNTIFKNAIIDGIILTGADLEGSDLKIN